MQLDETVRVTVASPVSEDVGCRAVSAGRTGGARSGDPPPRTLLVVDNLEIGGAQEAVRTLASGFARKGLEISVCALRDGPLREPIERLGLRVDILRGRTHSVLALPWFVAEMIRIRRDLLRIVDERRIDVIQTHLLRALDFLVLSLRLRRRLRRRFRIFWTIHNTRFSLRRDHLHRAKWLLRPKRWMYRQLYRFGSRWVDGIVAVSDEVQASFQREVGGCAGKITVICNGVDVDRYRRGLDREAVRTRLGIAGSTFVIGVVATFKTQKGHAYLLEAAASLVRRFPQLHFLFVGDGELREDLLRRTRALDLEAHVDFLGIRNDVPELLGACDAFVLPSLWEGLPVALLEAMAAGLPIIATAVDGTKQAMVHAETGWLVAPRSVSELEQALIELLTDQRRARAMGTAAQRRVSALFGTEPYVAKHLALYCR